MAEQEREDVRAWMSVEQVWDRFPERFRDRGFGPDGHPPGAEPEVRRPT